MGRKHGDWYHYAGAVHVHTTESDGTKSLEEVAAIGSRAGLDFILFADHMTLENRDREREGYYGNCLALVGYEHNDQNDKNHFLIFDSPGLYDFKMTAEQYVAASRADSAIGIMAHPDEQRNRLDQYPPYEWTDWSVDNVAGIEIWNQMSEWMEQLTPANRLVLAFSPRKSMIGPTERTLRKWDEINRVRRCVGVVSVDAHAFPIKVGPFTVEIFPYKVHFRTLRTHIMLPEPLSDDLNTARRQVYSALLDCRVYGSNMRWGDADGFEFVATNATERVIAGGQLSTVDEARIEVYLPHAAEIRLIHDGRNVVDTVSDKLLYTVEQPGLYRVEAWRKNRGWIFSNHIRIGTVE